MADLSIAIRLSGQDAGASALADRFAQSLRAVGEAADRAQSPLERFGGFITQGLGLAIGTKLLDGFAAALKGVGESTVGMNAKLEQSSIAFTTMLGSAEKAQSFLLQLQQFAATTPFEFKELVPQAQRLQAMGFAATEVIPLLRDVGNTAAAMGTGQAGIDRITYALGQMNAATKVHAQDIHQLTEAGVPAWQILADAIGKTTAETMKDAEQGRIASDVFIKAFHDFTEAKFGDMMERQSRTFLGALSNIQDVTQQTMARAFTPFFEMLRDGAVTLADFLQGEGFQRWAVAFQTALAGVMGGLREFGSQFAPIGEAFRKAFTELTNTGNVSQAFAMLKNDLGAALQGLVSQAQAFAGQMAGAGANLVTTFAQGMLQSASSVLQAAVDTIAGTIASFLIGHSPPEQGPLREIATGGRTLMETYGQGMQGGLDPVRQAVAQVSAAFQAAGTNLDQLKEIGRGVDAQIREIARSAHDVDSAIKATKDSIQDIKDVYQAQLEPLEAQHRALTSQRDTTAELARLNNDLALNIAQQAEQEARGDSAARARLQTQIQLAQAAGEEARLGQSLIETQTKLADLQSESLKFQLERNRLTEEGTRLAEQLRKAETPDPRFAEQLAQAQQRLTGLQRPDPRFSERESELARRLQELQGGGGGPAQQALERFRQQQQATQAATQLRNARTPQARQAALAQQQETRLQQAAAAERKQEEIDRVKRQQEVLAREKAEADAKRQQEIADAQRRIDQINREAALNAAERERQATAARQGLQDLELKRQQLDQQAAKQQAIAGYQQAQLQATQDELTARQELLDLADKPALAEAQAMTAVLKAHDEAAKLAQQRYDIERKVLDVPIVAQIAALKDEQTQVLAPLQAQLEQLGRQKDALGEQRTAWAEVKADIMAAEGQARALAEANKQAALSLTRQGTGLPTLEIATPEAVAKAQESGKKLAEAMSKGLGEWLQAHSGEFIGAGIGAAIGAIAFGPLGAIAGAGLGVAIADKLQATFAAQNIDFASTLQTRMGEAADALGAIFNQLRGVWETFIGALTQLGVFDDLRDIWNTLATDVGPKLAAMVGGMGPLFQVLGEIIGTTVVLAIKALTATLDLSVKSLDLTVSAVKVAGDAFNKLGELTDKVMSALVTAWVSNWGNIRSTVETVATWFHDEALPRITDVLKAVTGKIQDFGTAAVDLFHKYIALWQHVFTTDLGTLGTEAVAQITQIGGAIVAGLQQGITNDWERFKGWFGGQLQGLVSFLRGPDGIDAHSPSKVFATLIGRPMIDGIQAGFEEGVPTALAVLLTQTQGMADVLHAVTHAATDQAVDEARQAQAIVMGQLAQMEEMVTGLGGQAYPGGGLGLPGATGGAGGGATQSTGPIGGSGTGNQFGMQEFINGTGSAYPGSGLSAWRQNAPPVSLTALYRNSAPGYGPIIQQPTTTSLFSRPVGPPEPGPTGMNGPSYDPHYLENALYNMNPTGYLLAHGITPMPAGYAIPRTDTMSGDAAPVVINQTISVTGTSPDELLRQNNAWLRRAQWEAGVNY